MTPDDTIYLILLLVSTSFGYFVRQVKHVKMKQYVCTLIGFILLAIVSGFHILHPLVLTTVNAVLVLHVKRTSEYFGIPSPPEITNTALMIMVLKMVGLAYEINISCLKQKSDVKEPYLHQIPTFLDIIQYSFCYVGIFVGPYFKFQTYEDMFTKPYSTNVSHSTFLKKRVVVVPLYICLYLVSDYLFPLSIAVSDEIWKFPFLCRIFLMMVWFFSFRMRIYIAFVLAECICINLGLGAYPESTCPKPGAGPTSIHGLYVDEEDSSALKNMTYSFECIRCMDEFASEFRPTIREGIRYWNMTVQYWLAIYIYRKTDASKPVKMTITMFVSAIWHGVRPGYYLSLLGTPLLLIAEIEVEKAFRKNIEKHWLTIYDYIWYCVKMFSVSYMGLAFILLDVQSILNYWSSIYYIGHFFTLFMFSIAFLKNNWPRTYTKRDKFLSVESNKAK
ncbi:lysophospholipid acyltransferase 7-like isoform X2 [Stegodyphus dumicola]|uniref:lysophospholipid acyltransferase 7-like isoform X2 n=1 Tax=Stegodyphus dumicola TaxID=202533 RepID=UPI0015ADDBB9|nr:lysophospholipid acyltransferase 7-like isoform X2 [Stegodyphus dumicola]